MAFGVIMRMYSVKETLLSILWTSGALSDEFQYVMWMWTPPPYVHLMSTSCSCDKCFQAYLKFRHSSATVNYTEY